MILIIIYQYLGSFCPSLLKAGTTIACKNHGSEYLEEAKAVLLIMRNPYDSFKVKDNSFCNHLFFIYLFIQAEFNRKQTDKNVNGVKGRSHVGHADPSGK